MRIVCIKTHDPFDMFDVDQIFRLFVYKNTVLPIKEFTLFLIPKVKHSFTH
jgi:hypothetical protein